MTVVVGLCVVGAGGRGGWGGGGGGGDRFGCLDDVIGPDDPVRLLMRRLYTSLESSSFF